MLYRTFSYYLKVNISRSLIDIMITDHVFYIVLLLFILFFISLFSFYHTLLMSLNYNRHSNEYHTDR